ncbi:hypothetical protein ACP4OV_007753 [Aristida adscensionis]
MEEDRPRFLPDDVLEGVLRRLAPRSLAVSRGVCRQWRAVADERCALRTDLLPVKLGRIFLDLGYEPAPPELFLRPSMAPRIAGGVLRSYVPREHIWDLISIVHCCNGLLLLFEGWVVNPATRECLRLPQWPTEPTKGFAGVDNAYLAFDPTVSPHFDVILFQDPDCNDKFLEGSEWPPSPWMVCVYSSRTGRWDDRLFTREWGPAGTLAEVRSAALPSYQHDVYWHEALYVHYRFDIIIRITLSDDKYEIIRLPVGINTALCNQNHLGKSRNGVYLALVKSNSTDECQLQVHVLNELGGKKEWVLKHAIDLQAVISRFFQKFDDKSEEPFLQDDSYCQGNSEGSIVKNDLDWDSDDDDAIHIENRDTKCFYGYSQIFGFHPYKEIIFLHLLDLRVVAYHLNCLKVQDLGELQMHYSSDKIDTAFIYTPCWTGELSGMMNKKVI